MAEGYRLAHVASRGWFGRLGGAFKGLLFGGLFLLASLVLQFWNEGRTVARDAVLDQGRGAVQSLAAARPDPALEGRLVHVVGEASAAEPLLDEEFGVRVPALALRRRVEMYQWVEKRDRREEKQIGGGTQKVTRYRYEARWDEDAIDSGDFAEREGHENPGALPFASQTRRASGVKLGEFLLAPEVSREIGGWEAVAPDQIELPPNLAASFRADGKWFSTSVDPKQPAVGDVRVRFERVPAGRISVLARQAGATLVPQAEAEGGELLLVARGEHAARVLFDREQSGNRRASWLGRGAGFVLAFVGFTLLFAPLVVLADVVPLLGRLAGFGSVVAAAVCAGITSVVGIGSGWVWHRPWLLVLVLLGVVALVAGTWTWAARRRALPPPPPAAMPPPPPSPGTA